MRSDNYRNYFKSSFMMGPNCLKSTRDNVVELLNVTPSQAYRMLKKMSDKGRINLVGSGRAAYYELFK